MRIKITGSDHPHIGETGTLTGKIISVLGTPMAEVKLDNCPHGTDACFVKQGEAKKLKEEKLGEYPITTSKP